MKQPWVYMCSPSRSPLPPPSPPTPSRSSQCTRVQCFSLAEPLLGKKRTLAFSCWASLASQSSPFWSLDFLWILLLLSHFSHVQLCVTPSLGFSKLEHWSRLPFPSPMHKSEKWKWSRSVMSDSSWPHGLQPTRLLRPWDFPGKSTGVGCQCLLC